MTVSIDIAVSLLEKNDLEQPLLIETTNTTEEEYSRWNNMHLGGGGDGDDEEDGQKTRTSSTAASCWRQKFLMIWQFLNGFCLGLIIQTVSLGSTAIIAIHSGAALESPGSMIFWTRVMYLTPIYYIWLLFTVTCIAIVDKFFVSSSNSNSTVSNDDDDNDDDDSSSSSLSHPSQCEGSSGDGRFHVGIVFGVFIAFGMIDLYFGAPFCVVWLLSTVICVAIVDTYFVSSSNSNSNSNASNDDDDDDVGGFRFHVGVGFGWFIVMGAIDLYFGAPLGEFATLFASLLACLSLCYMAWWSSMIDS